MANSMSCAFYHNLKKEQHRDFLEVQWIRLHTPNTGSPGSIPGQVTRFRTGMAKREKREKKETTWNKLQPETAGLKGQPEICSLKGLRKFSGQKPAK